MSMSLALEQGIDGHRLRRQIVLPCAAAASGLMSAIAAHLHARRVREVRQIDRRDISAADNSNADFVQECLPYQADTVLNDRRAKRSKSFGLSCSITRYFTPGALIAGISVFQSSTPWPTSAWPSSSAFSTLRREIFDVKRDDAIGVFLDPGDGIFARPRDPADVGLPMEAGRGGKDVVERIAAVRKLGELEGVVVPGEIDAVRRKLLLVSRKLGAKLSSSRPRHWCALPALPPARSAP